MRRFVWVIGRFIIAPRAHLRIIGRVVRRVVIGPVLVIGACLPADQGFLIGRYYVGTDPGLHLSDAQILPLDNHVSESYN